MSRWNLIEFAIETGAENMIIDQALLSNIDTSEKPTLRLYGWKPEAISLGYFQKPERELNLEKVAVDGIDVVKRVTGGRAVLHAEELTYSVVGPCSYPGFETLESTYTHISNALVQGLQTVGVSAQLSQGVLTRNQLTATVQGVAKPCFASTSRSELTLNNKKLVGSAQRRLKRSFIQHGSLMMGERFKALGEYLNIESGPAFNMLQDEQATSLAGEGVILDVVSLKNALIEGFSSYFDISFE
ncbi:MAG: lipoate--protein ligase family protein [Fibrobacterales bacterium]